MASWFQTQDPSFVPRNPAEITAAAGRGGYQAPTGYANPSVFGGYDPRTGQYNTQPDPRYQQPPASEAPGVWGGRGGMTPLSQVGTGVAGGAPRVPSTARVPEVGSPDWYAGQFPGAPQAQRGYNPFEARLSGGAYDPAQGHGYTPATAVGTGEGPAGAMGGGTVMLRAPTGQTRRVPAAQAAFFLARGASKV